MRVTTAFNQALALPGAWVESVTFTADGIVVGVRRRGRVLRCPCGQSTRARYDRSRRRWRHLNFGASRIWLEAEVARVDCARCGRVRTEQVLWARPGARHTRDFEDVVAWLAQRMDKTSVTKLLRCSWEAVDAIVRRVVVDHIDDTRLDNLYRIGMDEVTYRRGHVYLTVIADHDSGRVVWVGKDRTQATVNAFFDALGPKRASQLQAVTSDGNGAYLSTIRARVPHVTTCMDPFHVIKWTNEALDATFNAERMTTPTPTGQRPGTRAAWRKMRFALRSGAERLPDHHRDMVLALRRSRYRLFRAWELKEMLRDLYRNVAPDDATAYLKGWLTSATRSKIPAFGQLAKRLRRHFDSITAAVQLGLSNSRLEGINTKIRVIQRRGYGHPNPESLAAMIYLCLGGITITLPQ